MGFISGTVTNSQTPGADIQAILEAEMTAVGWTFIEEVVISASTYRVWKSPAASNSFNQDWHLVLRVNSTYPEYFHMAVAESYDSAANTLGNLCMDPAYSDTALQADGSAGYDNLQLSHSYVWFNGWPGLNKVAAPYWFIVDMDNIIGTATPTDYPVYTGFYDPLVAGIAGNVTLSNIKPGNTASTACGSQSRLVEAASTDPGNDNMAIAIGTYTNGVYWTPASPDEPHPLYGDIAITGKFYVWAAGSGAGAGIEWLRGLARHLRTFPPSSNISTGDTVTDGVDTYVCLWGSRGIWMKTTNIGTP